MAPRPHGLFLRFSGSKGHLKSAGNRMLANQHNMDLLDPYPKSRGHLTQVTSCYGGRRWYPPKFRSTRTLSIPFFFWKLYTVSFYHYNDHPPVSFTVLGNIAYVEAATHSPAAQQHRRPCGTDDALGRPEPSHLRANQITTPTRRDQSPSNPLGFTAPSSGPIHTRPYQEIYPNPGPQPPPPVPRNFSCPTKEPVCISALWTKTCAFLSLGASLRCSSRPPFRDPCECAVNPQSQTFRSVAGRERRSTVIG